MTRNSEIPYNAVIMPLSGLMENEVKKILRSMKNRKFIFNLGHGVLQQTPTKNVEKLNSKYF